MHKSALVLSGGGALGIAHVGCLEILEKKYEFDAICGVSAGAIVGAGIALGKNHKEIWKIIQNTNLFNLAFDFSLNNTGLVQGKKIYELLDEIYEGKTFKDLDIPLTIGTTDFATGEQILITEGKIADAVRSSLAIPLVFEPFFHPVYKRHLADGFLSQNFPLDYMIQNYQGSTIVGIDVATIPPLPKDFGTQKFFGVSQDLFAVVQRSFRIIYQNQQKHFPKDDRVILLTPDLEDFSSITLGNKNLKTMYEAGKESAINALINGN